MEIQLKQRLIGAVVIFTLLIIFLPMILEGDSEQQYVEQILEPPIPNRVVNSSSVLKSVDSAHKEKTLVTFDNLDNLDGLILDNSSKKTEKAQTSGSNDDEFKSIEEEYISSLKFIDETRLDANSNQQPKNIGTVEKARSKHEAAKVEKTIKTKPVAKVESAKALAQQDAKKSATLKRTNNEVYAVKVVTYTDKSTAESVKSYLMDIGMPAYINNSGGSYSVYVGPEIELKYIKALSDRVKEETKYRPEVVTHNVTWKTE